MNNMTICQCQVNAHGQRQLELDVTYPLTTDEKRNCYQLDLFIFNPYQLGMTKKNYGVSHFLRDLRTYTRHTIPLISLRKLADASCAISPITRISDMLSQSDMAKDLDEKTILYELRVIANVYQRQLVDTSILISNLIHDHGPSVHITDHLQSFLSDIDLFLETFRALCSRFIDPRVSDLLRESLRWSDESISLSTEKTQHKLYNLCRQEKNLEQANAILESRLDLEQSYRIAMGYPTVTQPDNSVVNELFVYREGMLKKWTEGCLFMSTEPARIAARFTQVLMGVAAGTAMAFAIVATFFAIKWFPTYSMEWAILIIIGYIAKDRIKEILRNIFISHLPRFVADQIEDLMDPAIDVNVGSSRTRVRFCCPSDLSNSIQHLRNIEGNVFRNIIPPENVIHFHKDTLINSKRILQNHKRLESITEIMRLKLDSWLANMDDPMNELFSISDGKRTKVMADRVYHLNIVISLSEKKKHGKGASLFRYRLILTRQGIIRIEHMQSLSA